MVMIIEMEIETIENGDDKSIKVAHERNIKKARKQVTLYTWEQATEDIIQRVVVSGVWHPSHRTTETYVPYKLNSIYEVLKKTSAFESKDVLPPSEIDIILGVT